MLFKEIHLKGIKTGKISLAFRFWKKAAVKKGSLIKTSIGVVEITAVTIVDATQITNTDANRAGYATRDELLQALYAFNDTGGNIYKLGVRYGFEDPRLALRKQTTLTPEEKTILLEKLKRLDTYSKHGAWTQKILTAIKNHPRRRAIDLASLTGYEKEWLKLNIRKLKNLGLTISHEVGYELSPLGQVLFKKTTREKD